MAAVTLKGVFKSFGSTRVVHGVDIRIEDGEFCVLVGPSGCGKSTLLRMIAGLEEITGGEIAIGGRVVNNMPPKERDIAMVFQNYALYPHMTVFDNMAFSLSSPASTAAKSRERVEVAANILGLMELPGSLPAPAVRRPAPARGHGPRHRARPAGVPVRRAAVQPGRQAAGADAHRDQGAAPAPHHHLHLRHARPDRGHDHGRQDRSDERRQDRADRFTAGTLRQPGQPVRGRVHRLAGDEFSQRQAGQERRGNAGADGRRRCCCRRPTRQRRKDARLSWACDPNICWSDPTGCTPKWSWSSPPAPTRRFSAVGGTRSRRGARAPSLPAGATESPSCPTSSRASLFDKQGGQLHCID